MMKTRLTAFVLTLILLCTLVACLGNENATVFTTAPPPDARGLDSTNTSSFVFSATDIVNNASGNTTATSDWQFAEVSSHASDVPLHEIPNRSITIRDDEGCIYNVLSGVFYPNGSATLTYCIVDPPPGTPPKFKEHGEWLTDGTYILFETSKFGSMIFKPIHNRLVDVYDIEHGSVVNSPDVGMICYYSGWRLNSDGQYEKIEVQLYTGSKEATITYYRLNESNGSLLNAGYSSASFTQKDNGYTVSSLIGELTFELRNADSSQLKLVSGFEEAEPNLEDYTTTVPKDNTSSEEYISEWATTLPPQNNEIIKSIWDTSPVELQDAEGKTYYMYGDFRADGSGFLGYWTYDPDFSYLDIGTMYWTTDGTYVYVENFHFGRLTFSSFDASPFCLIEVEKGSLPTPTPPPSPTPVHDSYYYYGYRMDSDGEYETIEVRISTYDKKASLYYNSMDAVIGSLHPIGSETVDYVYTQGRFTLQTRIGTLVFERWNTDSLALKLVSGFEEIEPLWEVFTTAPEGVD